MSENANSETLTITSEKPAHIKSEKPAQEDNIVKFPPFPDPDDADFDEDVSQEERDFYKRKYPDIDAIKREKLHCTACDRHLGCAPRNESRMRLHPMLRTLVCNTCHAFYNSGEFEKGDDGSELYCRWCGQGGQVYCCADCPHVFCAKCIKRNFGVPKIKEIENTDDWKCFKCKPECLWSIRALCWALLRYCDLKNKFAFEAKDPQLKEAYQKACSEDDSECCKHKLNRKRAQKETDKEVKKKETDSAKKAASTVTKIPPTIQVKKFASINLEENPKKAQKRSASPKPFIVRSPVSAGHRMINPIAVAPKKPRMPSIPSMASPIRIQPKNMNTYTRMRPKLPGMQLAFLNNFNGSMGNFNQPIQASFNTPNMPNNMVVNDNINLSLESLTQGLDMSAISGVGNNEDGDVVCTPDFPLEPLCEVREENNDDDVQCMTPATVTPRSVPPLNPPPLTPRITPSLNDLTSENIIQMTENDVTVNAATGGLKFRVDPQTLSSNKMYRLPDGRIFAINANPNMPGGFSATIVAVTESNLIKNATKGSMYAAKLSAVPPAPDPPRNQLPTPPLKQTRTVNKPRILLNSLLQKENKHHKATDTALGRSVDLQVPVEWFRYNLLDAIDSLQYSISKLQKIKKETTSVYLRTRTVDEMKSLHRSLDRLLHTSCTRFSEIRNNLNKELRQYISRKAVHAGNISDDEDDDDVEILTDPNHNDDPIFIDENSVDSTSANEANVNTTNEVDLTGGGKGELDNSGEHITAMSDKDPLQEDIEHLDKTSENCSNENPTNNIVVPNEKNNDLLQETSPEKSMSSDSPPQETIPEQEKPADCIQVPTKHVDTLNGESKEALQKVGEIVESIDENSQIEQNDDALIEKEVGHKETSKPNEKIVPHDKLDSLQDSEMSEELIENLLKDNVGEDLQSIEISEEFQE